MRSATVRCAAARKFELDGEARQGKHEEDGMGCGGGRKEGGVSQARPDNKMGW